ncbi:MAG: SLC13 family permease [Clostridia bacterium]|nr:SLC13 family permease [Clostridia bacterium]
MNKKTLGLIATVVVLAGVLLMPVPEGMTPAGRNCLGVLLAALILWTTEAIPVAVTALALIILQPIYGIAELNTAVKEFSTHVIFFVIATYGVSVAIMKTPLASRMARWLLLRSGKDPGKVILAFVTGTAIISSFVSNVPSTVLFMGLALSLLEPLGEKPGESRLGRALMIAIPFGAMIGGISTPAGSSINILALSMLERYAGITITFLDWMIFGIPIAIVMVPICAFMLNKIFKPNMLEKDVTEILKLEEQGSKLSIVEKKVLIIICAMLIFWIASTWVPAFNVTIVAVIGLIVFFLPGIAILNWKDFSKEVGWDAILMIGGVTSIGAAVVATGLSGWFVNAVLAGLSGINVFLLTGIVGMIINLLHLVLPIGPALVAMTIQPLSDFSVASGINPAIFGIITAFMAGCCMLLPLDAVPLITYNKQYYSMGDMFKSGLAISFVWVVIAAVWVPLAASFLG